MFFKKWREARRRRKEAEERARREAAMWHPPVIDEYTGFNAPSSNPPQGSFAPSFSGGESGGGGGGAAFAESPSQQAMPTTGPSLAFSTDGAIGINLGNGLGIDSHGDIGIAVGPMIIPLTHHEDSPTHHQPDYTPSEASHDSGSSSFDSGSSYDSGLSSYDSGSSSSFDSGSSGGGSFDSGSNW